MYLHRLILLLASLMPLYASAAPATPKMVHIEAERLPDMNTPRYSHSAFCVGGEIVVVGGHTSGFVPTPTAEYFSGGEWHQVETVYPHDNGFAIAAVIGIAVWLWRRRRTAVVPTETSIQPTTNDEEMMKTIDEIVERERLFLNPDLKLSDIAALAGTNTHYVSDCINAVKGCSFSQYLNAYRVEYAKQLMLASPNEKIVNLYIKSGFSNERTFFRVWLAKVY